MAPGFQHDAVMDSGLPRLHAGWNWRSVVGVFKLRIGLVIAFTALAGLAIAPGPAPDAWRIGVLWLGVLVSSACAGAFNQYYEYDIDAAMRRTRSRAFASGEFERSLWWPVAMAALVVAALLAIALAVNLLAAFYVFLGAFFYGVVYTVWLKRRTSLNIVVGGLAGSWAVLAGAAAVTPHAGALPLIFAAVLFLWTPPHFWSLAIAFRDDYAAARVPMLPVVVGDARAAWTVFASAVALVAVSLLPLGFGLGWIYGAGAAAGGALFLAKAWRLARAPNRRTAMESFHASLLQLTLLLLVAGIGARW
ncbi:MAG TPA: heme o synthase [Rhodocyclaceae bacterium]